MRTLKTIITTGLFAALLIAASAPLVNAAETHNLRANPQILERARAASGDASDPGFRAALGLSGLAVRAGARSVLGTLWKVNDVAAAKLMVAFYRELIQPGTSRATALRRAQVELLSDRRYLHPGYWSPFLIISNWL